MANIGSILNPLTGGLTGFLGGLFGGNSAKERAEKKQKMLNGKKDDITNEFERFNNADFTQLGDYQNFINRTEQAFKNRNMQAAQIAAVTGATPEGVAAEKAANANALAAGISQLGANAAAEKRTARDIYNRRKDTIDNQLLAVEDEKPNGWDIASNVLGGAASGVRKGMGLG